MRKGSTLVLAALGVVAASCSGPPPGAPVASVAPSADAAAAPGSEPGWTGITEPNEVIEARRALMTEAETLMKPVDNFIVGEPGDAATLRANAAAIEPMLLALPHLFPPTTNLFDPEAHDPPTTALPAIWQRFPAFQTFAESAERAAAALAMSEDGEPLREASARLRASCDACHAAFTKPYVPPKVTDEDRNFDFEQFLPK